MEGGLRRRGGGKERSQSGNHPGEKQTKNIEKESAEMTGNSIGMFWMDWESQRDAWDDPRATSVKLILQFH